MLGHPTSPETRKKIGDANRGRHVSAELRSRLSAANKARPWSQARRLAHLSRQGV
jgi:hypothetical protein